MTLAIGDYLNRFYVSEADFVEIRKIWATIQSDVYWIFDEFYAWLAVQSEFAERFQDAKFATANRKLVESHWLAFFETRIDDDYLKRRQRVGEMHAIIGLTLSGYYDGVSKLCQLFEILFARLGILAAAPLVAFHKVFRMEVSIVVETYYNITNDRLQQQNDALRAMSTPVSQLRRGLLFLPLIGILDSRRAQDVMTAMLQKIATTESKVFILDISGIAVVDTAVANYLIKISKATRLMGCTVILTGISGVVAQTIVELGVDTNELKTTGSLEDALNQALLSLGMQISDK